MLSVIIKKELKRVFSDRRLVFTTFILPALSIFIIYTIMGMFIINRSDDITTHKSTIYLQNAPDNFKQFVNTSDYIDQIKTVYIDKDENTDTIKQSIKEGSVELLVTFEDNFYEKVLAYKTHNQIPEINTFYNSNKEYSDYARNSMFSNLLNKYENTLLGERLDSIDYINIFDIDNTNQDPDLADEKTSAGKGLSIFIPLLLSILLFAGAMGIGLDSIAGEKERGTMATMLVTPIKRETIALGKIISLGIIAIISATSSFIGIAASLPFSASFLTSGDSVNLSALSFSAVDLLKLFVVLICLVAIYVCLICLFSITAKTVKEASTYISPIYMLVMIATFLNVFSNKVPEDWQFAIPVYGHVASLKNIFTFELTSTQFIYNTVGSLIIVLLLIKLITNKFNDEKVMFSA